MFTSIEPKKEKRGAGFSTSLILHVGLATTIMTANFSPAVRNQARHLVRLVAPVSVAKPLAEPPPPPKVTPRRPAFTAPPASHTATHQPLILPELPKLEIPRPLPRAELPRLPAPAPPKVSLPEPGTVFTAPQPVVQEVKSATVSVGSFGVSEAKAVPAEMARAVLPAGFPDAPADGAPGIKRKQGVAPAGFGQVDTTLPTRRAASETRVGQFGGTAQSGPIRAARSVRAVSAGFGEAGVADSAPRKSRDLGTTNFGDATVVTASAPIETPSVAASRPKGIEILQKPKPTYTDEARRKGIEGEVVIEALFAATGEVRVLRIVRGLGHGLDQKGVEAALGIRFRPAERDGHPIDATAVVHIVFQLAY